MIQLPGKTKTEQLQHDFTTELTEQMKKAALKFGVPAERLKYRVGNDGVVEIAVMSESEMYDRMQEEALQKRIISIKKARNRLYG